MVEILKQLGVARGAFCSSGCKEQRSALAFGFSLSLLQGPETGHWNGDLGVDRPPGESGGGVGMDAGGCFALLASLGWQSEGSQP